MPCRLILALTLLLCALPIPAMAATLESILDESFEDAPGSPRIYRLLSGAGIPEPVEPPAPPALPPIAESLLATAPDNCRTIYARRVLADRIAMLGPNHPYILQWLNAQATVFAVCKAPQIADVALPEPLATQDRRIQQLQQQDRTYQTAAMAFYRDGIDVARKAFKSIAEDTASPHRPAATYMLLELDLYADREVTLTAARALLRDPEARGVHEKVYDTIRYLARNDDWVEAERLRAQQYLHVLAQPLSLLEHDPIANGLFREATIEFSTMYKRELPPGWWLREAAPEGYGATQALADAAREGNDLATWALTPASPFSRQAWVIAARQVDGVRWRDLTRHLMSNGGRNAGAWALFWHSLRTDYDPALWAQIDADLQALQTSGADAELAVARLPQMFFHQVRAALMDAAPDDETRFDTVLQRLRVYPYRNTVHFGQLRTETLRYLMSTGRIGQARRFRDTPEMEIADSDLLVLLAEGDTQLIRALEMSDSGWTDRLPTNSLLRLAQLSSDLDWIADAERMAWTRLYALGDPIGISLDRRMRGRTQETRDWLSAPGAQRGDRTLLLDVLNTPGMNIGFSRRSGRAGSLRDLEPINVNDKNWWCPLDLQEEERRMRESVASTMFDRWPDQYPYFHPEQNWSDLQPLLAASHYWQDFDPQERDRLARLDGAGIQLGQEAIAWGESLGWFEAADGADRALAGAVRVTRYGCRHRHGTGAVSKRAFQLLHRQFPDSDAAKATPYWFSERSR